MDALIHVRAVIEQNKIEISFLQRKWFLSKMNKKAKKKGQYGIKAKRTKFDENSVKNCTSYFCNFSRQIEVDRNE